MKQSKSKSNHEKQSSSPKSPTVADRFIMDSPDGSSPTSTKRSMTAPTLPNKTHYPVFGKGGIAIIDHLVLISVKGINANTAKEAATFKLPDLDTSDGHWICVQLWDQNKKPYQLVDKWIICRKVKNINAIKNGEDYLYISEIGKKYLRKIRVYKEDKQLMLYSENFQKLFPFGDCLQCWEILRMYSYKELLQNKV